MYESLRGKKLLIIGSDSSNLAIIYEARKMGVYTIVVDGISDWRNAPAKREADEGWDVDYSNTDEIVERCRKAGVDGVFAGYSEFRVLAACHIANRLGTPFYANEEQINLTRNKRIFKDACAQFDIPTPRDYCFFYPMTDEEKETIKYPVIVKPADYAGRKGISVCASTEELDAALQYAASKSQSKTVIVEDYLDGIEFASVYTLSNGDISLSCLNEKSITNDQQIKTGLCDFLLSPARFYKRYIEELDGKVRAFIKAISANNGVIFFQGMVTEEKIYIFEMGYRINGNNDFLVIERFNGINYMQMCIAFSLCGDMCDNLSKDNPLFSRYVCTLPLYAHEGTIGEINYAPLFNHPNITNILLLAEEEKEIMEDGSTAQCVMKLKMEADSLEEMASLVEFVQQHVTVKDNDGNNMLFKPFNARSFLAI